MTTPPRVCVVVSAYNRRDRLPALVRTLQAQTLEDFEAILVDNGSTDDTDDVLQALTAGDSRFRILSIPDNRGPARARNLAWRTGRAPLVAFTDDDCEPDPTWLADLVEAADRADIVQGRTIPSLPDEQRQGWFDRSQHIERWSGRFETCNLLVPRSILERLDGFNERFRIAMGEDTDLGLRAVADGALTTFCDTAVVRHHVWPSGFREFLHQRRRYAEHVELMAVQPEARQLLRWRFVVRDVHLLVWALVPITLTAVWWNVAWVPLAIIVAWALVNTHRSRYRPLPAARRFVYSLLQFTGYAYEAVCFALASVRYRTLVV